MRALFCENSSRSSFSPRLGTVKVTPSKSIVADGRKGTITSRASREAICSTMYWMPRVSISAGSVSTPVESRTVCTPTMEPWRMRTKLQ